MPSIYIVIMYWEITVFANMLTFFCRDLKLIVSIYLSIYTDVNVL